MRILQDVELNDYTTIGIGGTIKHMFFPISDTEIIDAVVQCLKNNWTYHILAGGSNTVFDDRKWPDSAVVINLCNYEGIRRLDSWENTGGTQNSRYVKVCAGTSLQTLVDYAQDHNLCGLTGLNRVPGTVGGAIFGNAGAYGTEIKDSVYSVEAVDLQEVKTHVLYNFDNSRINIKDFLKNISKDECDFGYRNSLFKRQSGRYIITSTILKLVFNQDFDVERQSYNQISAKRDAFYPPDLKSPGSCFKNISFDSLTDEQKSKIDPSWIVFGKLPVAKVLEEVGSKQLIIGGARMRHEHANILINEGSAKFEDVQNLILELKERVKTKFGIDIEPEIRLIAKF